MIFMLNGWNFSQGEVFAPNSHKPIPLCFAPVAAGNALEDSDEYEELDLNAFITDGKSGYVAYRVTGDSMVGTINHGAIVIVDVTCQPKNGDIVVSRINGKNNVKRFERDERGGLYLISSNKKYKTKKITARDDYGYLGVVKGAVTLF